MTRTPGRRVAIVATGVVVAAGTLALAALAFGASDVPAAGSPTVSIASVLQSNDIVTGVRTVSGSDVVLTGTVKGSEPFLYEGTIAGAIGGTVTVLSPQFSGVTKATLYGPNTHLFNPRAIPSGDVRAVGSYVQAKTSSVDNLGMIYEGPVSGIGGTWTSLRVPADGRHVVGGTRLCRVLARRCSVLNTIAHSTMGDLVVGNYDLSTRPTRGNGFIYNLTTGRWTLMDLNNTMAHNTSLYGIWQDGGQDSRDYTLAGGAFNPATHEQEGLLINYNERTGKFSRPSYFRYANRRAALTHFEGITGTSGGFNLASDSIARSAADSLVEPNLVEPKAQLRLAMVHVPMGSHGRFGPARWTPINITTSAVCAAGCSAASANTVVETTVLGVYVPTAAAHTIDSYAAIVSAR